jgi:hypothetical protein
MFQEKHRRGIAFTIGQLQTTNINVSITVKIQSNKRKNIFDKVSVLRLSVKVGQNE